jgi:hypothetical protein
MLILTYRQPSKVSDSISNRTIITMNSKSIKHNADRRSGENRRKVSSTGPTPDRREGIERRSGKDRRTSTDRRFGFRLSESSHND